MSRLDEGHEGNLPVFVSPLPLHALGSITPGRITPCREAKAHGVVALGGVPGTESLEGAVARYIK